MTDDERDLDVAIRVVVKAAVRDTPTSNSVIPGTRNERESRRWVGVAAGIVGVVGVASLWSIREDARVVRPASTTLRATAETTTTTATTTRNTAGPSTLPPVARSEVPVAIGGALTPRVLYTAGVGTGVNDLGLERDGCSSCASPWAPLTSTDGRLVIADYFNYRWVVVTDGKPMTTVLTDATFDGQPRLGPDGQIYAPVLTVTGTPPATEAKYYVYVYGLDDLSTPTATYPLTSGTFSFIEFVGDGLYEGAWPGGRLVTRVASHDPALPTIDRADANTLVVTVRGTSRRWVFPDGWVPSDVVPLHDGSVVIGVSVMVGTPRTVYTRLWPDGMSSSNTVAGDNLSLNGERTIDDSGILQIELDKEKLHVVRYELPARPG